MNAVSPAWVCKLILLSAYLASNRVLMTGPQEEPVLDNGACKEDNDAGHSRGRGR